MKNRLLISTAAIALLAGTSFALAQAPMEQRQAPAVSGQAGAQVGAPEAKKPAAAEQKGRAGAEIKADQKSGMSVQAPDKAGKAAAGAKTESSGKAKVESTGQAQSSDKQKSDNAQKQDSSKNAQSKPDDSKAKVDTSAQGGSKSGSTDTSAQGQAKSGSADKASANVTLSVEQKSKIRETVIQSKSAPRVNNVNFSISIGTPVPRTVRYAPLPRTIVEFYPSWRGYDYFLVGDQIVVINPRTMRIVAVLDV
jgi:hypothetical protein